MKNSRWVIPSSEEGFLHRFDLRDIGNKDKYDFFRLHYPERTEKVSELGERYCPSKKILEVGSAEPNIGLLLAEQEFSTIGLDINIDFLKYSRANHETGKTTRICANATDLPFQEESLDGVITTELLEHCAYPEKIGEEACSCLNQGGFLVITTSNGDCIINRETRFSKIKIDRMSLKERQFEPAGGNHLFEVSLDGVVSILPSNFKILGICYLNPMLLNSHTYSLYRCFPIRLLRWLQMLVWVLPLLRIKLCNSIVVHAQKQFWT